MESFTHCVVGGLILPGAPGGNRENQGSILADGLQVQYTVDRATTVSAASLKRGHFTRLPDSSLCEASFNEGGDRVVRIPEPTNVALIIFGGVFVAVWAGRKMRKRRKESGGA